MSSGQLPRTPRYYPHMKVRGAKRKQMKPFYLYSRAMDRIQAACDSSTRAIEAWVRVNQEIDRVIESRGSDGVD